MVAIKIIVLMIIMKSTDDDDITIAFTTYISLHNLKCYKMLYNAHIKMLL